MTTDDYWYDEQIKRYVNQFCAIFQGMYVKVGKTASRDEAMISVPIVMGSQDRVAAAAATGHTQNRQIRLPMMSVYIPNYAIAMDRMKGTKFVSREVYVPIGDLPQNGQVVYQRRAVPYDLTMDLSIFTSNKDQQFQILEQIFMIFDPSLQIQTSDGYFDASKIVTVDLVSVSNEENFPPGTEQSNLVITITFKVDAYITTPADIRTNIITKIINRISAINDNDIGTVHSNGSNNGSIGDIYDQLNVPESVVFDINDISE